MGYASYQVVGGPLDGQWAGYGHVGLCGHPDCTVLVWRGVDAMCGANPHGGGEDSCGAFFCDAHLYGGTWSGSRCAACRDAVNEDCAENGHPNMHEWSGHGICACEEVEYDDLPPWVYERMALMAMQLRTEAFTDG